MTLDLSLELSGCMQTTYQMFYCLDESRYDHLVALFLPAGTLYRQGELLTGRDQIMQAMTKRSTTQRIRHVISNLFIESQSLGLTHVVAYMTAYRFDDGTLHEGMVAISRPFRMSIVRALMTPIDNIWKIAAMTFTPEFEFANDVS